MHEPEKMFGMGLIQTGFLLAMAAIAIPVVVHLLSRWQVRRLELGTMHFLQEVLLDSAHRRRLRRWLLLSTRLLLVGLLALLFARPYLFDNAQRDGDRVRIILIDRSASMTMPGQSGRLIDEAIAAGAAAAERAGAHTQVRWAWFDRHVEALPDGVSRPKPPRSTSGDTDYYAALSWARDRLAAEPVAEAEVILVTDLQHSGLSSDQVESRELSFPADVPVRVIDVGRTAANNLAIVNVSTGASQLPAGKKVVAMATLFNFGALPAEEVPIMAAAVSGERAVRLKKTLSVANEQAEEIAFDFGVLEAGAWQITVDIDYNDDLASDNRRFTAVNVTKPYEVLVLDPGSRDSQGMSTSYFLVAALEQGTLVEPLAASDSETRELNRFNRFKTEVKFLQDEAPSLINNPPALLVVCDAGSLSLGMLEQVQQYVSKGGRLLVFAGTQIDETRAEQWTHLQLAPGRLTQMERAAAMPFRIVSIASRGSMLDPFRDPQHGDLGRLAFNSLFTTDIRESTQVLAWFDEQRPALTEHRVGSGRVAWFLSAADNSASNWTTSPLYLPLIQQMAADLLGLTGEGSIRFRSVGDAAVSPERLPVVGSAATATVPIRNAANQAKLASQAPAGESLQLEQPGFREIPEALLVINTAARESDPQRVELARFIEHFSLTAATDDGRVEEVSVATRQRHELWPWLAAVLVVLLVFEYSLANRTPA